MCSGAPLPYYLYVQAHISKTFGLPPAQVYKDECMFSFATPLSTGGLYVNLATWQAYSAAFVGLFTTQPAGSAAALWTGGVCAFVVGGIFGALISHCYNLAGRVLRP